MLGNVSSPVKTVIFILASLVAFGVLVTILGGVGGGGTAAPTLSGTNFTSIPAGTGGTDASATAAKNAYCDGLAAGTGFYKGESKQVAAWTTSMSPEDVCRFVENFSGVTSILNLIPLILVGGAIAFAGYWLHSRRKGMGL